MSLVVWTQSLAQCLGTLNKCCSDNGHIKNYNSDEFKLEILDKNWGAEHQLKFTVSAPVERSEMVDIPLQRQSASFSGLLWLEWDSLYSISLWRAMQPDKWDFLNLWPYGLQDGQLWPKSGWLRLSSHNEKGKVRYSSAMAAHSGQTSKQGVNHIYRHPGFLTVWTM